MVIADRSAEYSGRKPLDYTIERIAAEARVSSATVSRALDPRFRHLVRKATLNKIIAICDRHDYRPRFSAGALSSGKTMTVGLISTDPGSMLYSGFAEDFTYECAKRLKQSGYSLTQINVGDEKMEEIEQETRTAFYSRRVDGFIVPASVLTTNILSELSQHSFPAAVFFLPGDARQSAFPVASIRPDDTAAFRELFRHLISTGRKNIGVVAPTPPDFPRLLCTKESATEFGLTIDESRVIRIDYDLLRYETAFRSAELLRKRRSDLLKYDALIVHNDQIALAVCAVLRESGVEPGHDIAVAGYDDIESSFRWRGSPKTLTTIHTFRDKIGYDCAELLLEQLSGSNIPVREVIINSKLVIRGSTDPVK